MTDQEIIDHAAYLNTEAGRREYLAGFMVLAGVSCDLTGDDDDADLFFAWLTPAGAPFGCDTDDDDDSAHICSRCNGSGEGHTDGSTCWSCHGAGDDRGWSTATRRSA